MPPQRVLPATPRTVTLPWQRRRSAEARKTARTTALTANRYVCQSARPLSRGLAASQGGRGTFARLLLLAWVRYFVEPFSGHTSSETRAEVGTLYFFRSRAFSIPAFQGRLRQVTAMMGEHQSLSAPPSSSPSLLLLPVWKTRVGVLCTRCRRTASPCPDLVQRSPRPPRADARELVAQGELGCRAWEPNRGPAARPPKKLTGERKAGCGF